LTITFQTVYTISTDSCNRTVTEWVARSNKKDQNP